MTRLIVLPIVILLQTIVALTLTVQSASGAPVLTGAALFSADSSGAYLDDGWNTVANDYPFNLWTSLSGVPINGPLNSDAAINVSLSPGTYDFEIFGSSNFNRTFHGLNLFFDNDDASPRISVFAPTSIDATSTSFSPDSNTVTPNIFFTAYTPGAGTNSFTSGGVVVTLTAFRWEYSSVQGLDVVSGYARTPDTGADNVGIFTLSVTSVPEPSTLVLVMVALATFPFVVRGRMHRQVA